MTPSIDRQIKDSLSAAHYENGYPHDKSRPPMEYVDEIHEQSGIEGYDPEDPRDRHVAASAVTFWRLIHRKDLA